MFRIIFLFVVLGLGLFAGTQYAGQQGYVLISVANKTIEMSVTDSGYLCNRCPRRSIWSRVLD